MQGSGTCGSHFFKLFYFIFKADFFRNFQDANQANLSSAAHYLTSSSTKFSVKPDPDAIKVLVVDKACYYNLVDHHHVFVFKVQTSDENICFLRSHYHR